MAEEKNELKWYIVQTLGSYENKVKADLERAVANRGLGEQIAEIVIPTEDVVVKKPVKRKGVETIETKVVQKKLFPNYLVVKMMMNPNTWYLVRNTRGVTGFPSADPKNPTPLSEAEAEQMGIHRERGPVPAAGNIKAGDEIAVIAGPWAGEKYIVSSVNDSKQTVTFDVGIFGRTTPVELEMNQVKKV